ncbi:MAG: hypothetical protein ACYSUC_12225 [Planctomycetota bacterium]|jgi:hypothetical protein
MTVNMFALDLAAQVLLHQLALQLVATETLYWNTGTAADEVDALQATLFQPAVFDSPVVARA